MILVDTSVYISFFNGTKNQQTKLLSSYIQSGEHIAITGIIYQEVLQGIKSDKFYKEIKGVLDDFVYINTPESIYLKSANLYRKLKKKGLTIRKSVDVIIAQTALNENLPLLENDKDFVHISAHTKLKLLARL